MDSYTTVSTLEEEAKKEEEDEEAEGVRFPALKQSKEVFFLVASLVSSVLEEAFVSSWPFLDSVSGVVFWVLPGDDEEDLDEDAEVVLGIHSCSLGSSSADT